MCARAGIGIGIGLSGGGKQREMEGRGRVRSKGFKNRKEEEKKEIKKKKERERKERQEKSKSRDQKRLSYLQEAALQTLTESYALFFSSTLIFSIRKGRELYTLPLCCSPSSLSPSSPRFVPRGPFCACLRIRFESSLLGRYALHRGTFSAASAAAKSSTAA